MKVETRSNGDRLRGIVLISENKEESALLDQLFGEKVGDDGLIGTSVCECRLSDGYGEHYIYIPSVVQPE